MAAAGVLVASDGTRFYTEAMVAAALGISVKDLNRAIQAGYAPPPEIRFGQKRVYPEYEVARLLRLSKAGVTWAPFR
jgi:hypothetical protein